MRIIIMASGTRGDIQPVIPFAKGLKDAGHSVAIISGSNFASWIESYSLESIPSVDMEALMQSELGVKWVESPNPMVQARYLKQLMESILEPIVQGTIESTKGADLLITGFVTEPYIQAIGEKRGIPVISCALQPYRNTRSGPASLLPIVPGGDSMLNRLGGKLTEWFTWRIFSNVVNTLRQRLDLPPYTARSYARAASTIPALYAFSRHVVPPTNDTNSYTTGYWFFDESYTPPAELVDFIKLGAKPVYVGFGSMSSSDPSRTLDLVSEALARTGQRGIIARGWSGAQIKDMPKNLFVLDKTSHTWLFPQMAALVHHGGAGTTAAGLRAGVPGFIVSHLGDQAYWERRVHELGVGPKAILRHQLTVSILAERIQAMLSDTEMQTRVADLGERIRQEDGVKNAVDWVQAYIAKLPQKAKL